MRFFIFLFTISIAHAASIAGKVVGITDGDTITVLVETDGKKESVRVRLWGIDAPEARQPFGQQAKESLSSLVFGKAVHVEIKDKDRYGRTVGNVSFRMSVSECIILSFSANEVMVGRGLAWWYETFAPNAEKLSNAQMEAKAAKRGLWAEPNPVPPWDWRRSEAKAKAVK